MMWLIVCLSAHIREEAGFHRGPPISGAVLQAVTSAWFELPMPEANPAASNSMSGAQSNISKKRKVIPLKDTLFHYSLLDLGDETYLISHP